MSNARLRSCLAGQSSIGRDDAVKAALRAGVAGRAFGAAFEPHRILITVYPRFEHMEKIAARLTLGPQGRPAPRPESRLRGFQRLCQGLGVHVRKHEHIPRRRIGADCRYEAIRIIFRIKHKARLAFGSQFFLRFSKGFIPLSQAHGKEKANSHKHGNDKWVTRSYMRGDGATMGD